MSQVDLLVISFKNTKCDSEVPNIYHEFEMIASEGGKLQCHPKNQALLKCSKYYISSCCLQGMSLVDSALKASDRVQVIMYNQHYVMFNDICFLSILNMVKWTYTISSEQCMSFPKNLDCNDLWIAPNDASTLGLCPMCRSNFVDTSREI